MHHTSQQRLCVLSLCCCLRCLCLVFCFANEAPNSSSSTSHCISHTVLLWASILSMLVIHSSKTLQTTNCTCSVSRPPFCQDPFFQGGHKFCQDPIVLKGRYFECIIKSWQSWVYKNTSYALATLQVLEGLCRYANPKIEVTLPSGVLHDLLFTSHLSNSISDTFIISVPDTFELLFLSLFRLLFLTLLLIVVLCGFLTLCA